MSKRRKKSPSCWDVLKVDIAQKLNEFTSVHPEFGYPEDFNVDEVESEPSAVVLAGCSTLKVPLANMMDVLAAALWGARMSRKAAEKSTN